jgi:hypothetical protein
MLSLSCDECEYWHLEDSTTIWSTSW